MCGLGGVAITPGVQPMSTDDELVSSGGVPVTPAAEPVPSDD